MAARYKAKIETPHGLRTCFEAVRSREDNRKPLVARFGGIPLKRRKTAVIVDRTPGRNPLARKEIITRLLRNRCELCHDSDQVQVHHVAKLADLAHSGSGQSAWAELMARKRRKTLLVCTPCHDQIHTERPPAATSATA
jgi:hypothetical protein